MKSPTILEKYEALPESLQTEVEHYIEFLLQTYAQTKSTPQDENKETPDKSHGYGSLAGQIIMSDDFDEPLEDLKDYM